METIPDKLIALARAELDYKESPPGSNRTKYGKWYGLDGNPWCMMFIMWLFHQAGVLDLLPIRTASCGALMNAAKQRGVWVSGSRVRPGDVLIYDFPGGAKTDHTGLVVSVGTSTVDAIEGNTGSGNDANGGAVQLRTRNLSLVLGAVRPSWPVPALTMENMTALSVGDTVHFTGSRQYVNSTTTASSVRARECDAKITLTRLNAAHPLHLDGGGLEGWVDIADVSLAAYKATVRVNSYLALRDGPGTGHKILCRLYDGDVVTVITERSGWGQLSGGGWVSLDWLRKA